MEDHQIINLFWARREQAITELTNKYDKVLRKISVNILNNPFDAEECVNDTYLAAWNSIPPQNPNPLPTYLCRIVRNLSIKKYHANTALKRNSYYDVSLNELEACISSPNTVDSEYEAKEFAAIIDAFLDTLNTEQRVMFMRRYWFSDSLADIAKRFRITEHNAAVRLSRTRNKLRKYLLKEASFHG